jgi:mono/diheme cytochrome c family protein
MGLSFNFTFAVVSLLFVTAVAARAVSTTIPTEDGIQAATTQKPAPKSPAPVVTGVAAQADPQVLRGRYLVISHACGECHTPGGSDDPAAPGWLQGATPGAGLIEFEIGPPPCGTQPKAKGCFKTRPRNLTPDNDTGMGRFTERQLFNALRFGLRPENTPDVVITSTTPGQGNFPKVPHYLAPPMPWPAWRHMSDADLRAIAAYLKRGLKPVVNKVPDSEGPPDFWASGMTPEAIGTHPAPAFPTVNEQQPPAAQLARVLRGRQMVIEHGCMDCHQAPAGPDKKGWLAGITSPAQEFVIGPCFQDEKAPCFAGRPKNLTPDKETGIGNYTDQQIFNALRYGLKPKDTPDVKITSTTPGQGGFPKEPHYLGPFMPWQSWRNMTDDDLRAIVAYLRYGVKPVSNKVADSTDTPDHWAGAVAGFGKYPAPPFPTANEVRRK